MTVWFLVAFGASANFMSFDQLTFYSESACLEAKAVYDETLLKTNNAPAIKYISVKCVKDIIPQ